MNRGTGHSHEFITAGLDILLSGRFKKRAKVAAYLKCDICGYKLTVVTDHTADVVSIDGKPYFIPRDFFAFSPVRLTNTSVKPEVEYVGLSSGIYVPVKYVDGEIMEELRELDKDFSLITMMRGLHGADDKDYQAFKEFEKKAFDILVEQSRILTNDLEMNGFRFEVGEDHTGTNLVIAVEKGTESYFIVEHYSELLERRAADIRYGFRGKWSLLGVAVFNLVLAGLLGPRKVLRITDPETVRLTTATLSVRNGDAVLTAEDGVLAAVDPNTVFHDHMHTVKYEYFRGFRIALTYAPEHDIIRVESRSKRLVKGKLAEYGRFGLYCTSCNRTVLEIPFEVGIPVDLISVDGKLYYVPKHECGWPKSAENIERDPGLLPEVEYIGLPNGLHVPKGYVRDSVLKEIVGTTDRKMQVELLIKELRENGFEIDITEGWGKTEVKIVGPDGSAGYYIRFKGDGGCYQGKWSPIGESVV